MAKSDSTGIVLLHGAGQSAEAWRGVIKALPSSFDCLAPELGFDAAFTLPGAVQQMRELVETSDHDELVLVGHSLGAIVVALIAEQIPERISSLVLSATQVCPNRFLMRAQSLAIRATPARLLARGGGPSKPDLLHVLDAVGTIDLAPTLREIQPRTLLLCGSHDRANLRATKDAAQLIPDAQVKIISQAGHLVNETHPIAFADAIDAFVNSK